MPQSRIQSLSEKVENLLSHCKKLESDNAALREIQEELHGERARLMQKNDLARNKIESMIGRLKALEQN